MSTVRNWRSAIFHLKKIFDQLPKKSEKDELIKNIVEIIQFLTQVNEFIKAMPTAEEAAKAKEALEKLENILDRNPLLKDLLSRKKYSKPTALEKRAPKASIAVKDDKKIDQEIEKLIKMRENEMRRRLLENKLYTKDILKSILLKLGISVPKKITKKELVDQIVTTIVNQRTYEGLRDVSE